MPYNIELISIGEDRYQVLQEAILLLNAVQNEFIFHLPAQAPRDAAASFRREEYSNGDVWSFLRAQRSAFGGNRSYIIAFVSAPLNSQSLSNIFGSHEAADGLAVVTLHSSVQYVREARRFCCYYMTRYALSFVNPLIKAHDDPERRNCYFHKKLYKPDIRASMDTGYICDQDQQQLDDPPCNTTAKPLSHEEREALRRMRQVVSGDYPHALIMKGGGVKGLAFAGALIEIEKYFWFDRHVGASAGAIAAVLLAAGYRPAELADILTRKNFRDFMDARVWNIPLNLVLKGGFYPGDHFFEWIASLLSKRISKQTEVLMSDLNGAVVYATRRGSGTVVFDSVRERKDTVAAFATRCSMSIPLFFVPQQIDGRRVYDGGLRNNFPVTRFLRDHHGSPFIALYLSPANRKEKASIGTDLLDIWIDGDDREVVDSNANSVVIIDTSPVGTVDFDLHQTEKDFLLKVGRASALSFLKSRNFDDGPSDAVVRAAVEEAESCRTEVKRRRKWRALWRIICAMALLISFILFIAGIWQTYIWIFRTSLYTKPDWSGLNRPDWIFPGSAGAIEPLDDKPVLVINGQTGQTYRPREFDDNKLTDFVLRFRMRFPDDLDADGTKLVWMVRTQDRHWFAHFRNDTDVDSINGYQFSLVKRGNELYVDGRVVRHLFSEPSSLNERHLGLHCCKRTTEYEVIVRAYQDQLDNCITAIGRTDLTTGRPLDDADSGHPVLAHFQDSTFSRGSVAFALGDAAKRVIVRDIEVINLAPEFKTDLPRDPSRAYYQPKDFACQ